MGYFWRKRKSILAFMAVQIKGNVGLGEGLDRMTFKGPFQPGTFYDLRELWLHLQWGETASLLRNVIL